MMATRSVTTLDKSDVLSGLFAVWDAIDAKLEGLPETGSLAATPLPPGTSRQSCRTSMGLAQSFPVWPRPRSTSTFRDSTTYDVSVQWTRAGFVTSVRNPAPACLSGPCGDQRGRGVLASLGEDDWNAVTPTPAGMDSYGRFMGCGSSTAAMHQQDIRVALQRPSSDDELDGAASRRSLDEIAATMAPSSASSPKRPPVLVCCST